MSTSDQIRVTLEQLETQANRLFNDKWDKKLFEFRSGLVGLCPDCGERTRKRRIFRGQYCPACGYKVGDIYALLDNERRQL